MSKGKYSLPSKIKYVFRAFKNNKDKKHLFSKVCYVLKNQGVRGLKEAVVSGGEEEKPKVDIFQLQQQETKEYKQSSESVLFVIFGEDIDVVNSATYITISQQKHQQDDILICSNHMDDLLDRIKNAVQDYVFFIKEGNYVTPDMRNAFGEAMSGHVFKMIYSDECIYDGASGEFVKYYIKPGVSLYDLYCNNILQQAVMFDRGYLVEMSNVITDTISGNFYGWVIAGALGCSQIHHITRILLLRKNFLSYEELSEQRYVLKHLLNGKMEASVTIEGTELVVTPALQNKKVSIVILFSNETHTKDCISAIENKTIYANYDVWVATNDETKETLKLPEDIGCIPCGTKSSYAQKCNRAAELVSSDVIVFLMDDQRIDQPDWLNKLMECLCFPSIAAVSPKIIRPENTIRYAGMIAGGFGFTALPFNGEKNELVNKVNDPAFMNRQISVLSASCFAIERDKYIEVGGIDEINFGDKFANAQLSFALQKQGYGCVYCASVQLISYSGEWYDSWYDKDHATAYINLLRDYGNQMTEDAYFTAQMKYQYLRGVPTDFRIFQKKKHESKTKSILIVSHDSMLGGATIALQYAASILRKEGYHVTWLSENEGDIFHELEKCDVPYVVDPAFKNNDMWLNYATNFDLIICSTITLLPQVERLKKIGKQVIWWVHEASEYYQYINKNALSSENIEKLHCLCGGIIAQKNFEANFPFLKTDILLYGVPDYAKNFAEINSLVIDNPLENTLFLSIGTIEKRKGQDILAEAIGLLKPEIRQKCLFVFVGKSIQADVYEKVAKVCEDYPDNVKWHEPVDRVTLMSMYKQSDVVLCTSREDPMPVFVTEAMMQSKALICSEYTGSAGVLTDGIDSLIYHNNDSEELAGKITQLILESSLGSELGKEARKTYEKMFSMEVFAEQLIHKVQSILKE